MKEIKLQLTVKTEPEKEQLGPGAVIAGIGSCFAQNVLERLHECGFPGSRNPCGIVYNAASITESLIRICREKYFEPDDFFESENLWCNWSLHGQMAEKTVTKSLSKANFSLKKFRETLVEADMLIVTPSSSVIYMLKDTGKIVANCHKIPDNRFERRIMSYEQNLKMLDTAVKEVNKLNPTCRILLTLSPVRHYPGDPELNSRSKANLMAALRQCVDDNSAFCKYFPSYEIMHDELRDYRFYKEDMCHPTDQATEIVFRRFAETWFNKAAIEKLEGGIKAAKKAAHKPLKKR